MLKAGVIGLGIGARHAQVYADHPACGLLALCDLDPARLREVARDHPQARLYQRAEELLDDPELDVVSIASYDDMHFAQTAQALRRGKHVFVEKPLCQSPEQLGELRDLLRQRPHLRLSSNLVLRVNPRFALLRQKIQAGEMGEVFHIEAGYNYGRLHKITQGWRGGLDYYSVMQGGGVHMVDLLLWLTGRRVTRVAAFGNRIASAGSRFAFNDMMVAIVTMEGGATAKISANFGCVMPHFHELTVFGTKGTFINRPQDALLYTSRLSDDPPQVMQAPFRAADKGGVLRDFLDTLVGGGPPLVRQEEVMEAMAVCLAMDQACQSGATVEVG